jgi:seryl-tRNA synthetase
VPPLPTSPTRAAMWNAERVVATPRSRGELWEAAPGVVGLRGDTLALYLQLRERIADLARASAPDEWRVPEAIPLAVLERADYFASFPHWLTLASHLDDRRERLEAIARSRRPALAASGSATRASAALPPAVCYHTYAALADSSVASPTLMTAEGTCWRHEGDETRALERGWAFTMREVVCLGTPAAVEEFVAERTAEAIALASACGIQASVEPATDPFFAPTGRGRELLQRLQALKHELRLPLGPGRTTAAASFNDHRTFFGEAFAISLADGAPASSGCAAFGLERWLLAFLVEHGPDPARWPHVLHPLSLEG